MCTYPLYICCDYIGTGSLNPFQIDKYFALVTSMMNDKKRKEKFGFGGSENKRNAPLQIDLFKAYSEKQQTQNPFYSHA